MKVLTISVVAENILTYLTVETVLQRTYVESLKLIRIYYGWILYICKTKRFLATIRNTTQKLSLSV